CPQDQKPATRPLPAFVLPALRKAREGRGTHRIASTSQIKAWAFLLLPIQEFWVTRAHYS
ncbi:MAG: hypothetical protein WBM24_00205, partial [Candidatus Sulfotelmatobacter sp.]